MVGLRTPVMVVAFLALAVSGSLSVPQLSFAPIGDRAFIYANNPEQIMHDDLADVTGVALLQLDSITGKNRVWYEGLPNIATDSGVTALGYAVVVANPPTASGVVSVTVTGRGFTDSIDGGYPFQQLYGSPISEITDLAPAASVWIQTLNACCNNETVFQGMVDFEIGASDNGGGAVINIIAYADRSAVPDPTTLQYVGVVTRVDPGPDHEAAVYKGYSDTCRVGATGLDFVIPKLSSGESVNLTLAYATYNTTLNAYNPQLTTASGWTSNISPNSDPTAVASDMVPLWMPGWGWIDPLRCCDARGLFPNVGGWGMEYTLTGSFANTAAGSVRVELHMSSDGCESPFAMCVGFDCLTSTSASWRNVVIEPGQPQVWYSTLVASSETVPFQVRYALGGPGCGGEYHWLTATAL